MSKSGEFLLPGTPQTVLLQGYIKRPIRQRDEQLRQRCRLQQQLHHYRLQLKNDPIRWYHAGQKQHLYYARRI